MIKAVRPHFEFFVFFTGDSSLTHTRVMCLSCVSDGRHWYSTVKGVTASHPASTQAAKHFITRFCSCVKERRPKHQSTRGRAGRERRGGCRGRPRPAAPMGVLKGRVISRSQIELFLISGGQWGISGGQSDCDSGPSIFSHVFRYYCTVYYYALCASRRPQKAHSPFHIRHIRCCGGRVNCTCCF